MKYLKIEDDKCLYWDGKVYQEIDKINKDGLLVLLNAAETNNFEMDAYSEGLIKNKAHQVIYENIYSKFEQFLNEKDQFKKEVDCLYMDAINKYSADIQNEHPDNMRDADIIDDTESEKEDEEIKVEDIPF